jgi:hypothetical protein
LIALGELRSVVCIYFHKLNTALIIKTKFFEDGTEHTTGATPRRPKIHQDRLMLGGLKHLIIK